MWTYFAFDGFCFVLPLSFENKKKKRVKYRPLWQLNFFPGHHEPVADHLGTQNVENRHLAPSNLTFLLIAIDRNGFLRTKEEGQIYNVLPQFF